MKIRIPMVTKPGIPNANKVMYTEEAWERMVTQIENTSYKIPVTDINYDVFKIDPNGYNNKLVGIPFKNIIGTVEGFDDGEVIAKIYPNCEKKVNDYLNDGRQAFMRYSTNDIDQKDGNIVVNTIDNIVSVDIEPVSLAGIKEQSENE
jgi:hypothetical protein